MIFLLKYWRLIAFATFLAGLGITHLMAYNKGIDRERGRSVTQVIEIREDLNEIRNLRPDDKQLVNRLRRGKF